MLSDNNSYHKNTERPSGGEMFVGLNLLSRVGIILIIVGIIAFAFASEGYIPPLGRLALITALGVIMLAAGEFFYRTGSVVFAGALTFGGVAELFVAVPLGRFALEAVDDTAALLLALLIGAGGLSLAMRYKSQALAVVTVVMSCVPLIGLVSDTAICFGSIYVVMIHAGAAIIARCKDYRGVYIAGLVCSTFAALWIGVAETTHYDTASVAMVMVTMCCLMYSGGLLLDSAQNEGTLTAFELTMLILFQSLSSIIAAVCAADTFSSGKAGAIVMIIYAAVYVAIAMVFIIKIDGKAQAASATQCFALTALVGAALFAWKIDSAYLALHIIAAVAYICGELTERRSVKIWGIVSLIVSEVLFLDLPHSEGFVWLFAGNVVIWLGLMVFSAIRGKRSKLFSLYSGAAIANAGVFGMYLLFVKLYPVLREQGAASGAKILMLMALLGAAIWFALGYITGKLEFMGNGAPICAMVMYGGGLVSLFVSNIISATTNGIGELEGTFGVVMILTMFAVNLVSVLAVLDFALKLTDFAPKFARAVGLMTSAYALFSLTAVLGNGGWVAFTSCVISIIYLAVAAVWIVIGFRANNALMRRFGLALSLFASAKLFLFDFSGIGSMARTLMFIGFGITLLCISFAYGWFERKAKNK